MIAVVHEVAGAQAFNDGWWKGDLYFDEDKAFYKALGGGDLQWRSPLRLMTPTGLKTITNSVLHVSLPPRMESVLYFIRTDHICAPQREKKEISEEKDELWAVYIFSTKGIKVWHTNISSRYVGNSFLLSGYQNSNHQVTRHLEITPLQPMCLARAN
jgi:hypothetical protein